MAFGDGHNDIEMLDVVGYPIVMENGSDEVKQHACYICDDVEKEGILKAFQYPVTIITGGPGRGKTTDISFIIEVEKILHKNAEILLCAPTGRARRRMSDCTACPALTIHKAIGLKGEAGEEEWDEESMLEASLIIVDECSMIDMPLMDKFRTAQRLLLRKMARLFLWEIKTSWNQWDRETYLKR